MSDAGHLAVGVLACLLLTVALAFLLVGRRRLAAALRREQALRRATTDLVGAASRAGVRDAALAATVEILGAHVDRSWRVDSDPAGTIAQAAGDDDLHCLLDGAELGLFPADGVGIDILRGPSLLHASLGVPSTEALVLIALPARGLAREAAIVPVQTVPRPAVVAALREVAGVMSSALERLNFGEVMLERRSERRLRLMLRYASDVICILDHDLTVVHVTPAVEPIIGVPAPELLGLNWLELVAEPDRVAARNLVSLAQGGRPARGEIRLHSETGSAPYVDAVVVEVIEEDLTGFVVTCHDITQRVELEQQLTHQAFHDSLTGLANRALFRDRLGHAMARARRHADYGVLFVDLDDFKTVNDSLGHAAGDALLREMTTRLRACLRDGDTAARLGGDGFAVLLEDLENQRHCEAVAERMLAAVKAPYRMAGTEVSIGASIGIVIGGSSTASPEELMRNADLALYDAKNGGKNRYSVFAQQMHDHALARLSSLIP